MVCFISSDGESVRAVEIALLDEVDVFWGTFEVQVSLSNSFCIPMHDAKCLMTVASTLSSPGHQKRIRAAVSRVGRALLRLRARRRSTMAVAHKDNTTTIYMTMLSLIRRQPIFYPRQVNCIIQFRRLRFLLRVAFSPLVSCPTGVNNARAAAP